MGGACCRTTDKITVLFCSPITCRTEIQLLQHLGKSPDANSWCHLWRSTYMIARQSCIFCGRPWRRSAPDGGLSRAGVHVFVDLTTLSCCAVCSVCRWSSRVHCRRCSVFPHTLSPGRSSGNANAWRLPLLPPCATGDAFLSCCVFLVKNRMCQLWKWAFPARLTVADACRRQRSVCGTLEIQQNSQVPSGLWQRTYEQILNANFPVF